ncbi:MAG: arginase family protein [Myxococcales bacterium FL481]|nr:MAG: arginase family protein [Myxococcales bacterium FL481]
MTESHVRLSRAQAQLLLDELACYLRPPGEGVFAVSTGRAAREAATRAYLGGDAVRWREHLERLLDLESPAVALLAVPCDTGAGIVRGASWGPEAIRAALGQAPVFDLGDVFVVPQLLHDEMHSRAQIERTQDAIYPTVPVEARRRMPVSPLSVAQRVYAVLGELRPDLRVHLLGGDHSVTWPAMAYLLQGGPERNRDLAIVHFDAHTDLTRERLGVRYCFATWALHANDLLGGGQRLLQIGIRASGRERAHWEREHGVRQIWGRAAQEMSPSALAAVVVDHLGSIGARRVFISNDIDGTDCHWAAACGTPEPGGLRPEQVHAVLGGLADAEVDIIGADLVELAPVLSLDRAAADRSTETATAYVRDQLNLLQRAARAKGANGAESPGNTPGGPEVDSA